VPVQVALPVFVHTDCDGLPTTVGHTPELFSVQAGVPLQTLVPVAEHALRLTHEPAPL
jgi:hypothetical protein